MELHKVVGPVLFTLYIFICSFLVVLLGSNLYCYDADDNQFFLFMNAVGPN